MPNDILVEIELMELGIPELSGTGRELVRVALSPEEARYRPIVIFTSNSEKALPEPFLRRCVCHHLGFPRFDADLAPDAQGNLPEDRVTVDTIVAARLGTRFQRKQQAEAGVGDALDLFRTMRGEGRGLTRRPTLAELLDWLDHLMPQRLPPSAWTELGALRGGRGDADTEQRLLTAISSLLLKRPADKARAPALLDQWRRTRNARP